MTTFIGLNTIDQPKKFTLTDFKLIKRDLLNAFLIREGELPGRPELGTRIWNFIFEPSTQDVRDAIRAEVQRVILQDPRLQLSELTLSSNHNTVIIEASVVVLPDSTPETLSLVFNQESNNAVIL